MKGVFFETKPWERAYLESRLSAWQLKFEEPCVSLSDVAKSDSCADCLSTFISQRLDAGALVLFPSLRLIATRSTGFDHIDLDFCRAHGIAVCNVPTYGENTVAEHTFAMILSLSRNLHKAYTRASAGNFSVDGLQGFDLKGKTIGVVGTGHIGLHVIRIAQGFDMNVLAYDPNRDIGAADLLGFTYTT